MAARQRTLLLALVPWALCAAKALSPEPAAEQQPRAESACLVGEARTAQDLANIKWHMGQPVLCRMLNFSFDRDKQKHDRRLTGGFLVHDDKPQLSDPISSSYFQPIAVYPQTPMEYIDACQGARHVQDPVIFVSRDHENLFHFLRVHVLPAYIALRRFGLEARRFKFLFLDIDLYEPAEAFSFLSAFRHISGSMPERTEEHGPPLLCGNSNLRR